MESFLIGLVLSNWNNDKGYLFTQDFKTIFGSWKLRILFCMWVLPFVFNKTNTFLDWFSPSSKHDVIKLKLKIFFLSENLWWEFKVTFQTHIYLMYLTAYFSFNLYIGLAKTVCISFLTQFLWEMVSHSFSWFIYFSEVVTLLRLTKYDNNYNAACLCGIL